MWSLELTLCISAGLLMTSFGRGGRLQISQYQILRKGSFPVFHIPRTVSGPTIFQASHIWELKYYVTISEKMLTWMSLCNSMARKKLYCKFA